MTKAVLFDMDGLLFDTEGLGIDVGIKSGRSLGYPVTEEMGRALLGVNETESTRYLQQFFPDLDGEEMWKRYADMMKAHVAQHGTPLKAGCVEIIAGLREKGIPYAIVSSSSRHVIDFYLSHSPLNGLFDTIVSGDMQLRSKPAPDCFLKGAEMLGVPPHNCCVLEDSLNGLRAGRAAGMRTIMVPDIIPYGEMHKGLVDCVAQDLNEALQYILEDECSTL